MKRSTRNFVFCTFLLAAFFVACRPEEVEPSTRIPVLPAEPFDYASIPTAVDFAPFGDSVIDNKIATLGRVLFYDQRLSLNNRVSCGSCHRQQFAFADNRAKSVGFMNEITGRNTQQIVNPGMQGGLFWDLRERLLEIGRAHV